MFLLKNRISFFFRECARESRRRKKELLDTLEATIKELKEENASLKKQIKLGTSGDSEGEKVIHLTNF